MNDKMLVYGKPGEHVVATGRGCRAIAAPGGTACAVGGTATAVGNGKAVASVLGHVWRIPLPKPGREPWHAVSGAGGESRVISCNMRCRTGANGKAIAADLGVALSGACGFSMAGPGGLAITGDGGTAIVEDGGVAVAGVGGFVSGGARSLLIILRQPWDWDPASIEHAMFTPAIAGRVVTIFRPAGGGYEQVRLPGISGYVVTGDGYDPETALAPGTIYQAVGDRLVAV